MAASLKAVVGLDAKGYPTACGSELFAVLSDLGLRVDGDGFATHEYALLLEPVWPAGRGV